MPSAVVTFRWWLGIQTASSQLAPAPAQVPPERLKELSLKLALPPTKSEA